MISLKRSYAFLLLITLYLCSCSMPEKPVSKEEAMKLARRIEYSAAGHDYTVLNNIFDEKELSHRISNEGGLFMSKTLIKGAIQGFQQGQYGKAVIDAM